MRRDEDEKMKTIIWIRRSISPSSYSNKWYNLYTLYNTLSHVMDNSSSGKYVNLKHFKVCPKGWSLSLT